MSAELLPCPFCGKKVGDDLSDILYPNGTYWREDSWGRSYFGHREREATDGICYSMHCTVNMGGCGAEISADSEPEVIAAWNRRATPTPPVEPVKEADVSAIRDAALEEAARACESAGWTHPASRMLGPEGNCLRCATAIRALRGRTA